MLSVLAVMDCAVDLTSMVTLLLCVLVYFLAALSVFTEFASGSTAGTPIGRGGASPGERIWFCGLGIRGKGLGVSIKGAPYLVRDVIFPALFCGVGAQRFVV